VFVSGLTPPYKFKCDAAPRIGKTSAKPRDKPVLEAAAYHEIHRVLKMTAGEPNCSARVCGRQKKPRTIESGAFLHVERD